MRIVLISGCSSGFGMLTAVELVNRGFLVIATMRNLEKRYNLEKALLELSNLSNQAGTLLSFKDYINNNLLEKIPFLDTPHPNCKLFQLDVTDLNSIQNCVENVVKHFGKIDVLINNAGSGLGGFGEDISLEQFHDQFETNFFGLVALTKFVIPRMRINQQGHIVNISSIAGLIGVPGLSSYCASKFAVEGFSESLRYELLPFNVWVSLVEPGTYPTNIHDDTTQLVTSAYQPNSAYYEWGKTLLSKTLSEVQNTNKNPQEVAIIIGDIVEKKRPKLRYIIGTEKFYVALKKIVPNFIFEKCICWMFG